MVTPWIQVVPRHPQIMARVDWRIKLLSVFVIFIVSMGYLANIFTYEEQLGTENILQAEKGQSTVGLDDVLVNLSFENGAENLSWNAVQVSLSVDGNEFPCMVGGMSSIEQSNGTIQSKLNADGRTFTINIDTTSEDVQYLDLFTMSSTNDSSASLSVQKTDVFLGENVTGGAVSASFDNAGFEENLVFDESTEQRLEWYSYDLLVHRIIPDSEVYIVQDRGVFFKMQFVSYYDGDGEARHITLLAAPLGDAVIPAMVDESMVQISPCSIIDNGDGVWGANETISLQENGIDVCSASCSIEIIALYEQQLILGERSIGFPE